MLESRSSTELTPAAREQQRFTDSSACSYCPNASIVEVVPEGRSVQPMRDNPVSNLVELADPNNCVAMSASAGRQQGDGSRVSEHGRRASPRSSETGPTREDPGRSYTPPLLQSAW